MVVVPGHARPGDWVGPAHRDERIGALADRYTYVPYIGLFIVPVWAIADICRRESPRIVVAAVLAGTALACCLVLTWRQLNTWRDSETLWRHALAVTEKNGGAHAMLGVALADKGRSGGAVEQFEESLRLDPGNPTTHVNLAVALVPLGRLDEAVTHLERRCSCGPTRRSPTPTRLPSVRWRGGSRRSSDDKWR